MRIHLRLLLILLLGTRLALDAQAADTSAIEQLQRWSSAAGQAGDAARGRNFFTSRHGGEWSCASCHGQVPTGQGKHASTGKTIEPLAPAFLTSIKP